MPDHDGRRREFLQSLRLYVRAHFGAEERCMFRHRCPAWEVNQRAHAGFSASLVELEVRFERDGSFATDAQAIMEMFDRWLHEHIGRIDVHLRPLVESVEGA